MKANELKIVGKFNQGEELAFNDSGNIITPIIKFCKNGDIFIKGKLAEKVGLSVEDLKEIVNG